MRRFLLLTSCVLWELVLSSVDFNLHLGSYQNPTSSIADGSMCGGGCNNSFTFCLQDMLGSCEYGSVTSSTLRSDNFSFDSVLSELNISNPLQFDDITPSNVGLQLVVTITNNAIELVDRVLVDIPRNTVASKNLSAIATYTGEYMNAIVALSYGIETNCPMDMYGSGCSVLCQPQNNALGHYFCNYVGERVCLDKYFQPDTNCSVFCEDVDSSLGHYTCDERGGKVCLSGYTNTAKNCTQQVADAEEETSTSSTVSGEEDSSSVAVTAGLIVLYVFVGYFTILACIVALFCICFVHCNCVCTQCCNSSFCFRLKCSPQILRKQRFKIKCPSSVATKVDTLQTFTAEKCCVCCSDIDTCDSDELAFWTEMVILIILCLPFAICLLALYAYAKSK